MESEVPDLTAPDDSVQSTPKMLRSIEVKIQQRKKNLQPQQLPMNLPDLLTVIAQLKFDKNGKVCNAKSGNNDISPCNTTIMGDAVVGSFCNPDSKWLVQCFPQANIKTLCNRVKSGEAIVNRRYLFVMIGANQVFRAIKSSTYQELKMLIQQIRIINNQAKIFICGVLPHPLHAKNHGVQLFFVY